MVIEGVIIETGCPGPHKETKKKKRSPELISTYCIQLHFSILFFHSHSLLYSLLLFTSLFFSNYYKVPTALRTRRTLHPSSPLGSPPIFLRFSRSFRAVCVQKASRRSRWASLLCACARARGLVAAFWLLCCCCCCCWSRRALIPVEISTSHPRLPTIFTYQIPALQLSSCPVHCETLILAPETCSAPPLVP